jgi:hypothetical protein
MHIVGVRLPLSAGWNAASALVRFLVLIPFPAGLPDCFYADPDLRGQTEPLAEYSTSAG